MGSWGNGLFENDTSLDLLDDLVSTGDALALVIGSLDAWNAFRERKAAGLAARALNSDEIEDLKSQARKRLLESNPHVPKAELEAMADDLFGPDQSADAWKGILHDTGCDEALRLMAAAALLLAAQGRVALPERRALAWRPGPDVAAGLSGRLLDAITEMTADKELSAELGKSYLRNVARVREALRANPEASAENPA